MWITQWMQKALEAKSYKMDIYGFWRAVLEQRADDIPPYFAEDAVVNWHCTNERFTVAEFVQANCEYPGDWDGEVERICEIPEGLVTVTRVYPKDGSMSFHVTSFMTLRDGKISRMDEYWADDGPAPDWRQEMRIGTRIK